MTAGEPPGRSVARAHLSQLIEMFGTDGCLRVDTAAVSGAAGRAPAPASERADTSGRGEPDGDERA
ncbi:hypothetical protein ABT097_14175 [Streptomyces sp. NPDC002225]|uniref:hypothetical protein n=1 Tax=Streptomyces sp. NPDC002225 TaxID=3154413 RepID=UPI00332A39C6